MEPARLDQRLLRECGINDDDLKSYLTNSFPLIVRQGKGELVIAGRKRVFGGLPAEAVDP